ncbi:S8 family serine peptidase [Halorussus caseinilyticus]|uniref:Fervidolysin-like N-terminal prodomain domain-containing protein n=1 Tax=Halorussus caseinilyticus TaxID=3034025 RepID=A0ABD5WQH6_9EURY
MSRRSVLKAAGASVATAAASGLAAAKPGDTVEVNVGFKSESGRQKALSAADEVVRDFNSIDVVTMRASKQAAKGLENNPNVRYVEQNGTMHALAESLPWGQERVDSDVLHANGELGSGADVAILDTGIDDDHPDLTDKLGAGRRSPRVRPRVAVVSARRRPTTRVTTRGPTTTTTAPTVPVSPQVTTTVRESSVPRPT